MTEQTWEQAAWETIRGFADIPALVNSDTWLQFTDDALPEWHDDVADVAVMLGYIAANTRRNTDIAWSDVWKTVISKQRDYGHGNILRSGLVGVIVRLGDKIERAKNLVATGAAPTHESLADTYMDMIGYCVLGVMLINGTFTLQLSELHANVPDSGTSVAA
jgi:hypothetical protein